MGSKIQIKEERSYTDFMFTRKEGTTFHSFPKLNSHVSTIVQFQKASYARQALGITISNRSRLRLN